MKKLSKYFKIFHKSKNKQEKKSDFLIEEKSAKKMQTPSMRFAQWQAKSLRHNNETQESLSKLYTPYQAPPGVRGKISGRSSTGIVMDCALSSSAGIAEWAGENTGHHGTLKAAFEDGLVFLGYPTLAEMANRPELRKPCHVIAREALREWIAIHATGNDASGKAQDRVKEIEREFARLDVRSLLQKMAEQSLLYGVSHLWINVEGDTPDSDGQSIPLAHTKNGLAKEGLKELRLIEPIWMTPNSYRADNPLCPDYYRPEHWWVQGVLVHHSRLLHMVPYEVSDLLKPAFNFGGLSLTQQFKPYAHNYLRIRNAVANIVANFSKLVLQTDMAANMSAGEDDMFGGMVDASGLTGRAKLLQALSEGQDTIIADKENEDIKIISTPLGGLDALQSQSQEAQAAIPGIPLVKLFGVTPKGLNASSEGEIRVFYDEIKSFQQANLRPVLEKIFRLCQINLWGETDPSLSFEFKPLWQLDPQEKASLEKSKADIDAINIKNNIITANEARERQQAEKESIYAGVNLSHPLPAPESSDSKKTEAKAPAPRQGSKDFPAAQDAIWDESEHPRNPHGQFMQKGTGVTGLAQQALHAIATTAGSVLSTLNPLGTAEAASRPRPSRSMALETDLAQERAKIADPLSDEKAVADLMAGLEKHPRLKGEAIPAFLNTNADLKGAPSKDKVTDWIREWGNGWIQSNDPLFKPRDLNAFKNKDPLSPKEKQAALDEEMGEALKEIWSDPQNRMTQDPQGKIADLPNGKGDELASVNLMKDGNKTSYLGALENGMDVFINSGFQRYFDTDKGDLRKKGFGLAHMEASHGKQYKALGFKSAEDYAKYVFTHADKSFYDPEKGNIMLALSKHNEANPTFGKISEKGENAAENLSLILQTARDGKRLLVRSGFPMGAQNNEVERKELDRPEIQERISVIKDIADDLEKIKDPEKRKPYLAAANHFFHDAPSSATIKDPTRKQPYEFRPKGRIFGAEGLKALHRKLRSYLAEEAQNEARRRNAETGQTKSDPQGTQVKKLSSQIPPEQEAVYGAIADPKDPKYRKAETWKTGGIKANSEIENPSAPEPKTTQAPQPKISHPQEELESPSATITETPPSPEEQTPQKPLFLGEKIPVQNTIANGNTSKNETIDDSIDNEKVMKSAKEIDLADKGKKLTVAGRSYKKHSGREGSSIKKTQGSPEQINQQAHDHINEILNDPNKKIKKHQNPNGRFGETYTLHASKPNMDGIRVSPKNEFIHFIDPEQRK